jgi:hypothetical protein
MEKYSWQRALELSSHRASRHVPSASLGHYASLSFVVIGRGQRIGDRVQRKEERDFSVGAAFSRDLTI